MRRSRFLRLLTLLVALLQIAAPPLASIADAKLERDSASAPRAASHVESHGSSQCPRVHPADCGMCQFVRAHSAPSRDVAIVMASEAALAVCPEARLGAHTGSRFALALPRAPPAS